MPQLSQDDVMDFMVTEAIVAKANQEMKQAEKTNKRQEWMKGHKDWAKQQGLV